MIKSMHLECCFVVIRCVLYVLLTHSTGFIGADIFACASKVVSSLVELHSREGYRNFPSFLPKLRFKPLLWGSSLNRLSRMGFH